MMSSLPFKSKFVLTVKVLRCEEASMGKFRDLLDTPDPFVKLTCKNARSSQKFKTKTVMNNPNAVWNEVFSFVLPNELYTANEQQEECKAGQTFTLKVSLYDEDLAAHDLIGRSILNLNEYVRDVTHKITLDYKKNGRIYLELTLTMRSEADFRLSLDDAKEEETIVKKRKEIAHRTMVDVFGNRDGPHSSGETPTIAIIGSGGGYRAMTSFVAATEVFQKERILDMTSYIMGLSGSGWFLISSLVYEVLHNEQRFLRYKGIIRRAMRRNLARLLVDIPHVIKFENYIASKTNEQQPYSFIDFYGYCLGRTYLKKHMKKKFSSIREYVSSGQVPFPVITALHVEPQTNSDQFNVHTEMTPFEVSFPNYGIHVPTELFGSQFYGGILIRKCEEQPVHFFKGMTGSALGITFDEFQKLTDTDPEFKRELEKKQSRRHFSIKSFRKKSQRINTRKPPGETNKAFAADNNENVAEVKLEEKAQESEKHKKLSSASSSGKPEEEDGSCKLIRRLLSDREFLLDRTAKVFNFVQDFNEISYRDLQQKLVTEEEHKRVVDSKEKHISFVDAAVCVNIPGNCALRRNPDIVIVMDFSEYAADDNIDFAELFKVEREAKEQGLKFPTIDKKKLAENPLEEVHVFKEEGCPTVIWITLSSKKYKESLKDSFVKVNCFGKKKSEAKFCVFGPESKYGTLKTKYTKSEFNTLNSLVKHNVNSSMDIIKKEIRESIVRKRSVVTRL